MLRLILTMPILVALALPVAAQQSQACKGKRQIALADGASGCVLGVRESTVTRTITQHESKSTHKKAVQMGVVLLNGYTSNFGKTNARYREICRKLSGLAKSKLKGLAYEKVVVSIYWPGVKPANWRGVFLFGQQVAHQSAFMNPNCRGVKQFSPG